MVPGLSDREIGVFDPHGQQPRVATSCAKSHWRSTSRERTRCLTRSRVPAFASRWAWLGGMVAGHPLLRLPGMGSLTAARPIAEVGDVRRFRSSHALAALAALAGVAPIPTSSGQVHRMRLNRGGNRRLNRALPRDRTRPGPLTPGRPSLRDPPDRGRWEDLARGDPGAQTPTRPADLPAPDRGLAPTPSDRLTR